MSPGCAVTVFEAGPRLMAKLSLTGGGRCNLTNTFESVEDLSEVYPRGHRLMRRLLSEYGPGDVMTWFEGRGVKFKVEDGGRVFPVSDDAGQIVRALRGAMSDGAVRVVTSRRIGTLSELDGYDAIVVTAGGMGAGLRLPPEVETVPPVPSLFPLKINDTALKQLPGVTLEHVSLSLKAGGKRFASDGPMVLTHKGLSGPAVLRLSSYAARELAQSGYRAELHIDFTGLGQEGALELMTRLSADSASRLVSGAHPECIPSRLWALLASRGGVRPEGRWGELAPKSLRRLGQTVSDYPCEVSGKAPWGDEFVTCGGVALGAVNPRTLEARAVPGLYFAGEILDIDAVTGGFNLQAAWSTAHAVASACDSGRERQRFSVLQ